MTLFDWLLIILLILAISGIVTTFCLIHALHRKKKG